MIKIVNVQGVNRNVTKEDREYNPRYFGNG